MHIFMMGNMHSSSWLSMHYKDAEGLVEKSKQCIICLSSSNLITKITSVFNMRDRCCAVRFDEKLVCLSCEVWACAASLNPGKGFCCYACEQTLKRSTQKKTNRCSGTQPLQSFSTDLTLRLAFEIRNSFQSVCQKEGDGKMEAVRVILYW